MRTLAQQSVMWTVVALAGCVLAFAMSLYFLLGRR